MTYVPSPAALNPAIILSALATMCAGAALAVQGTANGTLGQILGSGVFSATVSFVTGLVVLGILVMLMPTARAGIRRAARAVKAGEFPWWMTLGGFAGVMVVISQSFTVPLMGVAVFTMAYVCGQLMGALFVDNSSLPPGGRVPPTVWRLVGSAVVLVGVGISAAGVIAQGVPLWAPILPFIAGAMTSVQQATNGRLRMVAQSATTATFTNFTVGTIVLLIITAIMFVFGVRVAAVPAVPGELWTLIGGPVGVLFIAITVQTVSHLGVLMLSLFSLFGNLVGSLVIDLTFLSAHADVTWETYLSMVIVLAGVALTTIQPRRQARGR